jgi:hypothetical protein
MLLVSAIELSTPLFPLPEAGTVAPAPTVKEYVLLLKNLYPM